MKKTTSRFSWSNKEVPVRFYLKKTMTGYKGTIPSYTYFNYTGELYGAVPLDHCQSKEMAKRWIRSQHTGTVEFWN